MPVSNVTDGTEVWVWSGSFSDQISDGSGSATDGIFEFALNDLATQSFALDGTNIAFLTPTIDLLDSRVAVGDTYLGVSLFLDPGDAYFSGAYSNVGFSFSITGQSFATDPNVLSTLAPLTDKAVSTVLFLKPEGGGFASATGTGSASFTPEIAVVPLPASATLLLVGIGCLAGVRRKTRAR